MRNMDTHYVPLSQVGNGKPISGESPSDLAALLDHQIGNIKSPLDKITITMSPRDATALSKLLRKAYWAGL